MAAAERDSDFGHIQKGTRNIKTAEAAGHHDLHRPPLSLRNRNVNEKIFKRIDQAR
jgi:hypothetical protein